ncbi:hypothetical protein [Kingella oralis]
MLGREVDGGTGEAWQLLRQPENTKGSLKSLQSSLIGSLKTQNHLAFCQSFFCGID